MAWMRAQFWSLPVCLLFLLPGCRIGGYDASESDDAPSRAVLAPSARLPGNPRVLDSRYELTLFAQEPDIVTPIGSALDDQGRLLVVESHTMKRPSDYRGPEGDLIKLFTDEDADGRADGFTVFADNLQRAVRIAVAPDRSVYACCMNEVLRLKDTDGDGRTDRRDRIATLEPASSDFGMWSITLSPEGHVYFATTLVPFPHRVLGSDGMAIDREADGGAVFRCQPDGSGLEIVATGFWAPPALRFDLQGRLLMVDNDPTSRGPNRLIHCVEGGNYGYRTRYGPNGDSPLISLLGELPGQLGPIRAVEESPADLWVCAEAAFPSDYATSVLIPFWGEHRIERQALTEETPVVATTCSTWVQGDTDFRPCAIVADAEGRVYVNDWVEADHQNHGHGRIWRIAPRSATKLAAPRSPSRTWKLESPSGTAAIRSGLASGDAVARHGSILALARPSGIEEARELLQDPDPTVRLGAMAALRRAAVHDSDRIIRQSLADPVERIRRGAAVWIADERRTELRGELEKALHSTDASPAFMETGLWALAALDPQFTAALDRGEGNAYEKLPSALPVDLTRSLLENRDVPAASRAEVLRWLPDPLPGGIKETLRRLAVSHRAPLDVRAVESLADQADASDFAWLESVAANSGNPPDVSASALAAWAEKANPEPEAILAFLDDPREAVRLEAVLALKAALSGSDTAVTTRRLITSRLAELERRASPRLQAEIRFVTKHLEESSPADLASWQSQLSAGGDPAAGRRRFFSREAQCSTCHAVNGRGTTRGPDLGLLATSQNRSEILRSVVKPSEYFAPEYQLSVVITKSGEVLTGLIVENDPESGDWTMSFVDGTTRTIKEDERLGWRAQSASMMPEDLYAVWSEESLRDVLAFLSQER